MNEWKMAQLLRAAALAVAVATASGVQAQVRVIPIPNAQPGQLVLVQAGFPPSESFLGVAVHEVDSERAKALNLKEEHGVEITRLEADSPASKSGLKVGDVVLEYNGQRVEGTEQFVRLVKETPSGRTVKLLVSRGGALQTLTATVGTRKKILLSEGEFRLAVPRLEIPEVPDVPKVFMSWRTSVLGIEAESIEAQLAEYFGVKEGVLVRSVIKGSPAERAGIKAGDVIVKIEDAKIAAPREISSALRTAHGRKTFNFGIMRDKREIAVTVTVDDRMENAPNPSRRSVRVQDMKL